MSWVTDLAKSKRNKQNKAKQNTRKNEEGEAVREKEGVGVGQRGLGCVTCVYLSRHPSDDLTSPPATTLC